MSIANDRRQIISQIIASTSLTHIAVVISYFDVTHYQRQPLLCHKFDTGFICKSNNTALCIYTDKPVGGMI